MASDNLAFDFDAVKISCYIRAMKSAPQSKKQTYHHGDLKAVLLNETARILREDGEEALSLRRLASNIGVSRSAPYHHFKDKQDLLCAVAEEGFQRFNHAMDAALEKGSEHDGQQGMLEYVKAYVNFAVDNPEYYDLMFGGKLWRSASLNDSLLSSARLTLRGNVERIKRWQQQGLVAKDVNALRFSQVSWGTLHGISRFLIDGIYIDSASIRRICETAAEMMWQQLRPE
jgi:AcrR family transcriptional regulator